MEAKQGPKEGSALAVTVDEEIKIENLGERVEFAALPLTTAIETTLGLATFELGWIDGELSQRQ